MLTRADPIAQSFFQVILMVEYSNYDDKLVLQTVFTMIALDKCSTK